jgi:hypothetical protein
MTTPDERTRAVLDTRVFLQTLAGADDITVAGLLRTVAVGLLRHYPLEIDISESSSAMPSIWGEPKWRGR